ncbi:hypothetical protein P1P68_06145 [Streptomyces scabiei]|uniref:hypothetical protein n=1 Tax=Streptomyces scabiei TaxID=1930 RepID=UPI00298F9C48|nr:hypothetical protein [Streptomyces scabiei]MDW8804384.1 hypothetical protein [Streptomyces scabiei]
MAIVVVREMTRVMSTDFGQGAHVPEIVAVHATPADPDIPADPSERTLCGKPTADMELVNYQPNAPGASWLPPNMKDWKCGPCDQAVRG